MSEWAGVGGVLDQTPDTRACSVSCVTQAV